VVHYTLAELPFWSLQGEGLRTGEPTIFIRLAGCNADNSFWCWSWCDTKFARNPKGIGEFSIKEILDLISSLPRSEWICLTGGEPLCQELFPLLEALKELEYKIQIETNGTIYQSELPVDHWTLSPKTESVESFFWAVAKECKFVISKEEDLKRILIPNLFWGQVFLQPENNRSSAIQICIKALKLHPDWRLSLQLQKGINTQEKITQDLASYIFENLEPLGCGVIIEAEHSCISFRGVSRPGHSIITSAVLGVFREELKVKEEFFNLAGLRCATR